MDVAAITNTRQKQESLGPTNFLVDHATFLAFLVLAVIGIATLCAITPAASVFFSPVNLKNIAMGIIVQAPAVIGAALILSIKGIDLSSAAIASFSCLVATILFPPDQLGLTTCIGAIVVLGALFGLANGMVSVLGQWHSALVTLVSATLLTSLHFMLAGQGSPTQVPQFLPIGEAVSRSAGVYLMGSAAGAVLLQILMAKAGIGRLGERGGTATAITMGFADKRQGSAMIGLFVMAGALAAVSGLLLSGRLGMISPNANTNYFPLAAAIIGCGGSRSRSFNIVLSFAAFVLIGTMQNIIVLSGMSGFVILFAIYACVALAMIAGSIVAWLAGRYRSDEAVSLMETF